MTAFIRKNADKPAMLVYENVRKRYGTFMAVDGVSLHVNAGEVVCLIGPSGSGKSTLLRCTNALETIDGGEIRFEGKPLPKKDADIRQVRQRMGMVFQSFELFPHKTALENVAIGLTTVKKMAAEEARTRALALLAKVGLVVTHEMSFARRVANWVVVFERRATARTGGAAADIRSPDCRADAGFFEPSRLERLTGPAGWRVSADHKVRD